MSGPRVHLLSLSERTSAKGTRYMSGWLGKASVVAFQADEPDRFGNPRWDVFVSTPEPRAEQRPQDEEGRRPQPPRPQPEPRPQPAPRPRPQQARDGWKGSRYVRPTNAHPALPAADGGAFPDDDLHDLYREREPAR